MFSLFVTSGRGGATGRLAELNRLVRSLRVRRGDFYPGVVAARALSRVPRLAHGVDSGGAGRRREPGAVVGGDRAVGGRPVRPAAAQDAGAPRAARRGNRGHGLARRPLTARPGPRRPPFRIALRQCGGFEGVPNRLVCTFHGGRALEYDVDVWVAFGREHPSRADRARAQAELDRLTLPAWPRF